MTSQTLNISTGIRITIENVINDLDVWITGNGWAGYDPYDIRGQDWFIYLFGKQSRLFHKIRGLLYIIENNLSPIGLRKVLKVRKKVNAKGMGLLALAYICFSSASGCRHYLFKAEQILNWLRQNPSYGYPGISWGYPFHWQSRIMIPRGTPSAVVTGVVGDAWLDHYQVTGSPEDIAIAHEIAYFMLEGLNCHKKSKDQICFSYTPLDHFKVHNANLFVAAFLARLGAISNNDRYIDMALKATRFTLSEQNNDGSFNYWSSEPLSIIDHYHTGFILRHLNTIERATGVDFISEPLQRGYRFYLEKLFTKTGIPKFTPENLYPINIHSCSEAILTLSLLSQYYGGFEKIGPVLNFTLSKMRAYEGYFIAEIRQRWGREWKVEIPYMRWAQCWMLLALAHLYSMLVASSEKGDLPQCGLG